MNQLDISAINILGLSIIRDRIYKELEWLILKEAEMRDKDICVRIAIEKSDSKNDVDKSFPEVYKSFEHPDAFIKGWNRDKVTDVATPNS